MDSQNEDTGKPMSLSIWLHGSQLLLRFRSALIVLSVLVKAGWDHHKAASFQEMFLVVSRELAIVRKCLQIKKDRICGRDAGPNWPRLRSIPVIDLHWI